MPETNVKIKKATKKIINRGKGIHVDTLRVGAYCRVSTDNEEQLESYKSQVRYYTDMINNNPEWQMASVYADEAITGTQTKKREDFQRMINDCMNGEIDMIIVKSISRFARNTVDTLNYVRMLKEKHVAVLFEEENINTSTMDGELLLTILSSVAQQEVQNISEHVKQGLSMKMQRGEMVGFNGCLGYDYHPEDKSITVNPKEAEVVRYIFQRYVEGAGGQVIARELKNLGFKNKAGNMDWSASGIVGIIKNEKYKGDLLMGKTFTLDPISKRRLENQGEEDQYYLEDHHEPIISKEMYEMAHEILNKRKFSRSKNVSQKREKFSRQYAFSCLLKCGFCGGTLTRRNWNSSTNYKKTIWQCVTATKNGKHYCPHCKGIPEELIELAFLKSYNLLSSGHNDVTETFLKRVKEALQNTDIHMELKKVEKGIFDLKERKSRLIDMHIDGKLDEEEYQGKSEAIMDELDKLYCKQKDYKEMISERKDVNSRLLEFQKILNDKEVLTKFDRHVFECIIDKVIVGEIEEDGTINPYKLKFIYKTGLSNEVAIRQPLSFENPCLHTGNDSDKIYPHSTNAACGDGCTIVPQKSTPRIEVKMDVQDGDILEQKKPTLSNLKLPFGKENECKKAIQIIDRSKYEKKDIKELALIGNRTMDKLENDGNVTAEVMAKICIAL